MKKRGLGRTILSFKPSPNPHLLCGLLFLGHCAAEGDGKASASWDVHKCKVILEPLRPLGSAGLHGLCGQHGTDGLGAVEDAGLHIQLLGNK